jgi:hypothetical protein
VEEGGDVLDREAGHQGVSGIPVLYHHVCMLCEIVLLTAVAVSLKYFFPP